ncbi:hypothetical protein COCC4DRAFT_143792 [Bipolaris maydis ATCC 48331]|uniref:Uncharacterized protein n=2 Tax=Cochliobolus heterostrophus TaxID=5016 RepID=M2TJV3_COCH5|nr:uncharacterized protein COCC4DRAFT_143792 [Bipolaris maydis ATCC 48331]EMD86759.1 hypothetical protein COCHEDRAFT_1034525 [Bipolaris maydis C5]KAJ5052523.1 hypothetical protein J3E74DRAFT_295614 [Bipolaris maydis]ENI03152.1 hypothetical protein COCC4DRAFT_143792 [Bipolaris maydis ATCC 48331]KAJ6203667.1 hypothetical protein PSV09DRAFT_1034525 [Bipolaris maydis]KAJ6267332.1 hypothetical protein PSV08DRAFT_250508 [Bipolaris maydis]
MPPDRTKNRCPPKNALLRVKGLAQNRNSPQGSQISHSICGMTGSYPTGENISLKNLYSYIKDRTSENHLKCEGNHYVLPQDCVARYCSLCWKQRDTLVDNQHQFKVAKDANSILEKLQFEVKPTSGVPGKAMRTLKAKLNAEHCRGILNRALMPRDSILLLPTFNVDGNKGKYAEIRVGQTTRQICDAVVSYYDEKFRHVPTNNGQQRVSVHGIIPIEDLCSNDTETSYYGLLCTVQLR